MAKQGNLKQWLKKSDNNGNEPQIPSNCSNKEDKVSFMQFYKFSNIKQLLIDDIHQKYPDEEKRKDKCKDIIVFADFVYEKYCKNSRIPLLRNLKFEPKPWLTKKERKLRRKFGLRKDERVDLGSNNEFHAFAKEILPAIEKEIEKGSENANITHHLNRCWKMEVAKYGNFELALRCLEAKRVYDVDENRLARVVHKPCPMFKKVKLLKNFLEQLSYEAEASRTRFLEAMCLKKVTFAEKPSTSLEKNVTYRRKYNLGTLHETTSDDLDGDSMEILPRPRKRKRVLEDTDSLDELPGPIVDDGGSNFKVGTSKVIYTESNTENDTPKRCKPCPLSKKKFYQQDGTDNDSPKTNKPCPLSKKKFLEMEEADYGTARNENVRTSGNEIKTTKGSKLTKIKDGKSSYPQAETDLSSDRTIIESKGTNNVLKIAGKLNTKESTSDYQKPQAGSSLDEKISDITNKLKKDSKLISEKQAVPRASKAKMLNNMKNAEESFCESISSKTCKAQALSESQVKTTKPSPRKKSRIIRMKTDKQNFYDSDDSDKDMSVVSRPEVELGKSVNDSLSNASLLNNGLTKSVNQDGEVVQDVVNLDANNSSESIEGEIYFVQIRDIDFIFNITNINELLLEKLRQMFSQFADWTDEEINEKCIKKIICKMTPDMKKNLLSIKNLRLNEAFVEKTREAIRALKEIEARKQVSEKTMASKDGPAQVKPLLVNDLPPTKPSKAYDRNILLEKTKTFEEFKRNTNIEEFMRNDILTRYPSEIDTMLPKLDMFMKYFFENFFLKGEIPSEITLKSTAFNNAESTYQRNSEDSNGKEITSSVIPNSRNVQIKSVTTDSTQTRNPTPVTMTQIYSASQSADDTLASTQRTQKGSQFNILYEKCKTYEEFRKNTNIEEFMRNDIMKRYPATYDLMFPKLERFMKNFYKKHFLKGQIPSQITLKCAQNCAKEFSGENRNNVEVPNGNADETRKEQSPQYTCGDSQNSFQNETINKVFVECNTTISQAYAEQLLQNDQSIDLFPSSGSSISKSGNKKSSSEKVLKRGNPDVDPLCLSDIVPVALNECMFPILHLLSPENIESRDSNSADVASHSASKLLKRDSAISDHSTRDKSLNLQVTQSQNLNSSETILTKRALAIASSTHSLQNSLPATPAKSSQSTNTFLKGLESPGLINCSVLDEVDLDAPTPIKEELQFSRYSDEVEFLPSVQPTVIQIEDDILNASNLLDEMMNVCPMDNDNNILRLNTGVGPQTSSLSFDPKGMAQSTQLPYTDLEFAARANAENPKNSDSQLSSTEPFEAVKNSEDDLPPTIKFRFSQASGNETQRKSKGQLDSSTRTNAAAEVMNEIAEPSNSNENGDVVGKAEKQIEIPVQNIGECPAEANAAHQLPGSTLAQSQSLPSKDVKSKKVDEISETLKNKKTKQKVKTAIPKTKKDKKAAVDSEIKAAEDDIVPQVKHTFQPLDIEVHRNAFVARKRKRKEPFIIDTTNILRYKIQKPAVSNVEDTDFFIEDVTQEIDPNGNESHALTTDLLNADSSYFRSSQLAPNHYLVEAEQNIEQTANKTVIGAKNQNGESTQSYAVNCDVSVPDGQQIIAENFCEIVIQSKPIETKNVQTNQGKPSLICEQKVVGTDSVPAESSVEVLDKLPTTQKLAKEGKSAVINIIEQIIMVPGGKVTSTEENRKGSLHEQNTFETTVREVNIEPEPKNIDKDQPIENMQDIEKNAESEEVSSAAQNPSLQDKNLCYKDEQNVAIKNLSDLTSKHSSNEKRVTLEVLEKSVDLNQDKEKQLIACSSKDAEENVEHVACRQPSAGKTPAHSDKVFSKSGKQHVTGKVGDSCDPTIEKNCLEYNASKVIINLSKEKKQETIRDSKDISNIKGSNSEHSKAAECSNTAVKNVKENMDKIVVDCISSETESCPVDSSGADQKKQALSTDRKQQDSSLKREESSLKKVSLSSLSEAERTFIEDLLDEILIDSPTVKDRQTTIDSSAVRSNSECMQEAGKNANNINANEVADDLRTVPVHSYLSNAEDKNHCTQEKGTNVSVTSQSNNSLMQSNQVPLRVAHKVVEPNVTISEFSLGKHLDTEVISGENRSSQVSNQTLGSVHLEASQTHPGTEMVERLTIEATGDKSTEVTGNLLQSSSICSPVKLKPTKEPSSKINSVLEAALCDGETSMNPSSSSVCLNENNTRFADENTFVEPVEVIKDSADTSNKSESNICLTNCNPIITSILNVKRLETIEEDENEAEPTNLNRSTVEGNVIVEDNQIEAENTNCSSVEVTPKAIEKRTSEVTNLLTGYTFAPQKSPVAERSVASFDQLTLNNVQLVDIHSRMHRPLKNFYYGHITYLSLYKIKLSANFNRLRYESNVPFLQSFEKSPIQAVIDFKNGPYKKLHFCGESLRLLLGLTAQEWLSVFKILRTIETFEYSVFDKDPVDRSLFHRILYYLFKTLPKFSTVTFEYDITNINYATSCLEKRQYKTPFKCLSQAFDSEILQAMARAKRDL